jgi:hypothetical protein
MRALNATPDTTPRTAQVIAYLGQPVFGHQAPNGWPETGESWMNTGAILNRINFGMAAAAGLLPGASLSALPGLDAVSGAAREQQVDAVVAAILGGMVSSDTRAVLMSGEHPLLAGAARVGGIQDMSPAMSGEMSPEEMTGVAPRARQNGLGKRGAMLGSGIGNIPQLSGLAQIVGLALGSPEFQRR